MIQEFKLKGLNTPWKAGGFSGYYATVEYGKEDWFHSGFDESKFSLEQQAALFNHFKHGDDNIWKRNKNTKVVVQFDGYSSGGAPIKPTIIEIKNIQ